MLVSDGRYVINTNEQHGNNYQGDGLAVTSPELYAVLASQQDTIRKQTDQIDRLIAMLEQKM